MQDIITQLISKHISTTDYSVFIFGSRAHTGARKWSDYDIGIEGKKPLSPTLIEEIKTTFEQSNFPYHVDIVDFKTTQEPFNTIAKQHIIPLSTIRS